ncbi:MAG TPA: MFS transporter [Kofleriaceae bacterium]|nr:MFS transporter [Kofleriaceae bacterium]
MSASPVRLGTATGRWVIAAAVLGSGMAMLDATVVNVALPAIGDDLHAGLEGLQWTVAAYTLTLAAFLLLGGSLGDRFGRRRVFAIGTIWFAAASALCGLAPSIELLIAARALQGIGGALLTPGSLAMISSLFEGNERGRAIGIWSGLGGLAGAIGPFAGGGLVQTLGWRWVFFVNLPIAAAVVAIAARFVPESRDADAPRGIDLAGAALGAVALGGITLALVRAGAAGFGAVESSALAIGAVALIAFVWFERRARHPMLPVELFGSAQFAAGNAVTLLVYAALGGIFFVLVMDLQVVGGFSPVEAGAALLPVTALLLVLSGPAGAIAERIGPRVPMSVGPLCAAVGALLMLRIGARASYVLDVLPAAGVFGLGLAMTVAPLTSQVLGAAETRHAGVASGVNNAIARAAGLLAVAVIPLAAGLGHDFARGFPVAMITCAVLLAAGGVLSAIAIRDPRR